MTINSLIPHHHLRGKRWKFDCEGRPHLSWKIQLRIFALGGKWGAYRQSGKGKQEVRQADFLEWCGDEGLPHLQVLADRDEFDKSEAALITYEDLRGLL